MEEQEREGATREKKDKQGISEVVYMARPN